MRIPHWQLMLLLCAGMMCGCTGGHSLGVYDVRGGPAAKRGVELIHQYHCGTCHTIPGISHANGVFAPPLIAISRTTFIAGEIPNTPNNLIRWLMDPQALKPKTAMPNLGLSNQQAHDITAYLETLSEPGVR